MCRFLVVKSEKPFDPLPWLERFADMAEASRAPDGDRQADGWGVSWINPLRSSSSLRGRALPNEDWESAIDAGSGSFRGDGGWHGLKSVAPVWEERDTFAGLPLCRVLAVHARSASFPDHKGVLDYSQPFVDERHAFVFNGLLRGVSLPAKDDRSIGSQRIWDLFRVLMSRDAADSGRESAGDSLARLVGILENRTREVSALNIALCDGSRIYAYCRFADYPSYYHLHALETPDMTAVCSRPLPGLNFAPVPTGRVLAF